MQKRNKILLAKIVKTTNYIFVYHLITYINYYERKSMA